MPPVVRLFFAWLLTASPVATLRPASADSAELAKGTAAVFKTYCHRCHGQNGANEGGFSYLLDFPRLASKKRIVAGNPARSDLFRRIVSDDNPMPPEGESPRPSKADVALIKNWITVGAPDWRNSSANRLFIANDAIVRSIHDDLAKLGERDRRFTRYFALTHLANAGVSSDEMQSHGHGLAKLVNSLSWGSRVVTPQPIDASATVLRIDLRDYQWNEKGWNSVTTANPYAMQIRGEDGAYFADATGTTTPFVRADWFTAAASRPPLYHELLQIPETAAELEKLLRVDPRENIRQGRVARAGFNGSGVSRNNRLIERHESGAVVYWKSYDFGANTGRQNLFAHPLGPGDGENDFTHDGGELIFNLPNGLQAYMLVDGRGRRIDKGPTAIVSDPKRPDRAVENGLSCMSCHAKGIIEKYDQVREHVLNSPQAFSQNDLAAVQALYPAKEQFAELLRQDAKRFQDALAKIGAPAGATEPITALALRFEAELDLPLAAAEAGARPEELLGALDRAPHLAKQLGSLRVAGGTVQRQTFVEVFPDLERTLRRATAKDVKNSAFARLFQRGEALQASEPEAALRAYEEAIRLEPEDPYARIGRGDVHRRLGDYELAIADYNEALRFDPRSTLALNNRGLAYQRKGDFERAVADFTAALQLDPRFATAYFNRGGAYHRKGDFDEAIADYTAALRLDSQSAVVFNNRGLAHHEKEDYDRAIADFDKALKIDAKFAVAFNNRGLAYCRKGDLRQAVIDFDEAVHLDPKFAKAYFNRAVAREKQGDAVRAAADREKALSLDPALGKD